MRAQDAADAKLGQILACAVKRPMKTAQVGLDLTEFGGRFTYTSREDTGTAHHIGQTMTVMSTDPSLLTAGPANPFGPHWL